MASKKHRKKLKRQHLKKHKMEDSFKKLHDELVEIYFKDIPKDLTPRKLYKQAFGRTVRFSSSTNKAVKSAKDLGKAMQQLNYKEEE